MTINSLLTHLDIATDTWSSLPNILAFEFTNQRYLYTSIIGKENPVRWFKVINTGDGDPVLALQNRNAENDIIPGGFTFDGEDDIHQIFYINDISGITFR